MLHPFDKKEKLLGVDNFLIFRYAYDYFFLHLGQSTDSKNYYF